MNSKGSPKEAYVWLWLPGETEPVVAGRLARADDGVLVFNYGQSYLARSNAIPIYEPELPLRAGELPLLNGLQMPNCIRDASPDAWGRRVLLYRAGARADNVAELDELTYLLESGSDRIGALDFQSSPTEYVPRAGIHTPMHELMEAAQRIQDGLPVSQALDLALRHGTSIGGARPKVTLEEAGKKYIAKFSSNKDLYNVVKAEFVAMRLAALCSINTATVRLESVMDKDVLLVERFDRVRSGQGWARNAMISALTILGLDEMMARYASYEDLADVIRQRFTAPRATLHELFRRIVFNILCGNTDDHARNHAAFLDGSYLALTPAYDLCPQGRTGNEATQAMLIIGQNKYSKLSVCVQAAHKFQLEDAAAQTIIDQMEHVIKDNWVEVCESAGLTQHERELMLGRQFLNPFIFE
ncbi:type II toxin-antitoxin system HipA family toxin [Ferrovum sp.]|uniref:type II toxin-antitoxin system HipA family toxin n=1 Tax=Ferrovum sp. TaxID=2609467 RepID=UPI00342F2BDF